MTSEFSIRPLSLVEKLAVKMESGITHAYDDLVFLEHPEVLIQFDRSEQNKLLLHVATALEAEEQKQCIESWLNAAKELAISLVYCGEFSIEQTAGKEEINIRFSPDVDKF